MPRCRWYKRPVGSQPQRPPVRRLGLDEAALVLVDQTDIVMGRIGIRVQVKAVAQPRPRLLHHSGRPQPPSVDQGLRRVAGR